MGRAEINSAAELHVNSLSHAMHDSRGGQTGLSLPDGRNICALPRETDSRGVFPLYNKNRTVITRPGHSAWVPVTRAQDLTMLIAQRERARRTPQDAGRGLRVVRKIDPSKAEKYRADMGRSIR